MLTSILNNYCLSECFFKYLKIKDIKNLMYVYEFNQNELDIIVQNLKNKFDESKDTYEKLDMLNMFPEIITSFYKLDFLDSETFPEITETELNDFKTSWEIEEGFEDEFEFEFECKYERDCYKYLKKIITRFPALFDMLPNFVLFSRQFVKDYKYWNKKWIPYDPLSEDFNI